MTTPERVGAAAGAGLMAMLLTVPAGAAAGAASPIGVGHWSPARYVHGRPMQGYGEPRPGPYRDAAQFWKNYQFYYDECRRPPVRPEFDWDYVLSCDYGY